MKLHEKYLTENKKEMSELADMLARYVTGNWDTALKQMERFAKDNKMAQWLPAMQTPKDYNKVFDKVYDTFYKALTSGVLRK